MDFHAMPKCLQDIVIANLNMEYFVYNYRHGGMFHDGRVLGLFYVKPEGWPPRCAL